MHTQQHRLIRFAGSRLSIFLSTVLLLAAALLITAPPPAAADEGYDLMRIITSQWVKPSVMLLVDTSNSMKKDIAGHNRDVDWQGGYREGWWGHDWYQNHWTCLCDTTESQCKTWECDTWDTHKVCTHTTCDTWHWKDKCDQWNSDGVCTHTHQVKVCDSSHCDTWEDQQYCTHSTCTEYHDVCTKWHSPRKCKVWQYKLWVYNPSRMAILKNVLGDSVDIWTDFQPPDPFPYSADWDESQATVKWVKDYSAAKSYGYYVEKRIRFYDYQFDPGPPAPARDANGDPSLGTWNHQMPLDLVGQSADSVNWGLITFGRKLNNSYVNLMENIDPDDNAAVVASIEGMMQLKKNGGLNVGNETPTRTAIALSGTNLETLFNSSADCGQTYGSILITDGLSNIGNSSDSEWGSCSSDAATTWEDYPPGAANDAWHLFQDSNDVGPRTWAIGMSQDVGGCELNWTAFMGRTDASSPNGDAGFTIDADPYLSKDADSSVGTFDDAHGPYAYFSNSAAELEDAFASILAGMGVGDYTTSAPAVAGASAIVGTMSLLPSSDYPSWQGHLRAFARQTDVNSGQLTWQEVWDAGEVLASTNHGYTRKIYSWDSNQNLIEVVNSGSNVSKLDTLCGNCGVDASVVDFIRGNDGSGNARPWKLGALINTTPAVVGPPKKWAGGRIQSHGNFESEYASRQSLIWVGSSDGMIHAFDTTDGTEIIALIPPDLLDKQVEMYSEYLLDPDKHPMGQPQSPVHHIFGVTNSMRVADVWDKVNSKFRTVLYVSEGPGGTGLHAIDVTHIYPGRTINGNAISADPNYSSTAPVEVLWSKTADGEAGTTATGTLGHTWSVPALGVDEIPHNTSLAYSKMILAQGYVDNPSNAISPTVMMVDPVTGDIDTSIQLPNDSTYRVGNQAFANSVLWQTDSEIFHPDNLTDEGVQGDLNGTLWAISGNNWGTRSALFALGGDHPIYYSPSVGTFPAREPSYNIYTFSTGSYYEKSANVTGLSSGFVPSIILGVREISSGDRNQKTINITDIPLPDGQTLPGGSETTLSDMAQAISSSVLLTPATGSALHPMAFFLVYDPLAGECVGKSFIVRLEFSAEDLFLNGAAAGAAVTTYEAGEGAAGGFAIAGEKVVISQSGVGADEEAHIVEVPDLTLPVGSAGSNNVRWWMELQ